jgi:hypothetical protein
VPVGYLATVTPVALATVFALAPPRRPPALAAIGFRLGLALNELPFLSALWLIAATVLAAGHGDIHSAAGWSVLGLALVTVAGLCVVAWRGVRAGPAIDRAMSQGLGADWRTALDAGLAARLRRRLPLARILLAPWRFRRRDVERIADVG